MTTNAKDLDNTNTDNLADKYDKYGYDCDGYNKHGYNCDGYNSDGFDSDGYTSGGYTKEDLNFLREKGLIPSLYF